MIYRLIPAKWLYETNPKQPVHEGKFTHDELVKYNSQGYNIYFFPNYPSDYQNGSNVSGADVDTFNWVFVDFDLKSGQYPSKEAFIERLGDQGVPEPTRIVDSGNGVHVYWRVDNLDALSYLRFQRRLRRFLNTDDAVGTLNQLMRVPGYFNTKNKANLILCDLLLETDAKYTAEELDRLLPPITPEDEEAANQHFDKVHGINQENINYTEELPPKFGTLLNSNLEAKELFAANTDDRSKSDFRLGHLMFANGFTKDEARMVLMNTAKALARAPIHRVSYATNIVDKIWTFENKDEDLQLSESVAEILRKSGDTIKGTRFPCHPRIDNTEHGFRLGQVIGLVAGSGVGKTAFALNLFRWFAQSNPDYHHFFIPLEQPSKEIADRWKTMCQGDSVLHDKVHIISNYDDDGSFRNLSLSEIQEYIIKFQKKTGYKVGCVVIDHIGALKKKGAGDESQDLIDICHNMKAFAVQTNTLLVMQSQTSREKAGIGDLELNKDAAYGTTTFEWYCDYLITLWQPVKRCHSEPACPTVTAFKYCKIRFKKRKDVIQEDVPYFLYFDSETEQMKDMTQDQVTAFNFFLPKATNKRKADRKSEILTYTSVPYKDQDATKTNHNR